MALQLAPRIIVDPEVRFGRPVIQGTRVPVDLILAKLAGGMAAAEIADEHEITGEDIQATLFYLTCAHTRSNISTVSRPVCVFCRLG